ncbi:hypothetical protein DITRI_Ditri02bG0008000 [Diplodiscus trichospermus]
MYQEEHFINDLTPDIQIVKELREELKSLDLEAIGSVVTDVDIRKETKPTFYVKNILPILLQKRVVHFVGFGNRLAFGGEECKLVSCINNQRSHMLAAPDFIACTAADAFAMMDSGNQLSSLVSGYRIYYGGGRMSTIRPNKRRLADIFLKNDTIQWKVF